MNFDFTCLVQEFTIRIMWSFAILRFIARRHRHHHRRRLSVLLLSFGFPCGFAAQRLPCVCVGVCFVLVYRRFISPSLGRSRAFGRILCSSIVFWGSLFLASGMAARRPFTVEWIHKNKETEMSFYPWNDLRRPYSIGADPQRTLSP